MALTQVAKLALESALTEPSAYTEIKAILEGTDHTSPLTAGTGITTGTGTVYKSWKEQMVAEFTPAFLLTLLVCRQKDR